MIRIRCLYWAALVAVALTASVGASSASATVMCETETDPCAEPYETSTSWSAELAEGEGPTVFENSGGTVVDECEGSTTEGMMLNAGGSSFTVSLSAGINFSLCGLATVSVKAGTLELHHIPKTWNFTVTGKGAEFTIGFLFGTCSFSSGAATHLGTLTAGLKPRLHVKGKLAKVAGGFLCPADVTWRGEYDITTPTPIYGSAS